MNQFKHLIFRSLGIIGSMMLWIGYAIATNAQSVDFSGSYVVPEKSGLDEVTLGGVTTLWDNATYSAILELDSNYNLIFKGGFIQDSPGSNLGTAVT